MALRIMSYNILMGGEDRLPHIADVIQQQQPDAVALLEANDYANVQALAQRLGLKLIFGTANSEFHIAWMSRLPVKRTENYRRAVFSKALLEIEVDWEGTSISLFATHLSAGREQEREQHRVAEVHAILDILQRQNRPHILVGDFNSLHLSDRTDIQTYLATASEPGEERISEDQIPRRVIPLLLEAGYIDCYRALHPDAPGYTYKLPTPALRLDYIFISPSLREHLSECDVITTEEAKIASDHLPVQAVFE
jgi:exodeoxyribonuclease-3